MSRCENRLRARGLSAAGTLAVLGALGCVPLPMIVTPPVAGHVRDAKTGQPVAGAVVVVRYDARYDDLLPDRDVIAHRELVSAADGSFALGRSANAGLELWPLLRTEARVVGVIADGYRCPPPRVVSEGSAEIELAPALDADDRRDSCRPLGARAAEAPRYLAAWQALHPHGDARAEREGERELARVLDARSSFGFGENCQGPVVDLALAPDGHHVAWTIAAGASASVEVRSTDAMEKRGAPVALSEDRASRRLAWTARGELMLWEPASDLDRMLSSSPLGSRGADVVWRPAGVAAPPASLAEGALPLEPSDLRDEGDARRLGRTFQVTRTLDPESGLPREILRISRGPRDSREIELPGEPCGPHGDFGQPQLRIAADTRTALDLRYAGDGCGVVAIDLETGKWKRLDTARGSICAAERGVPMNHLRTAMRGYATEVEEALEKAGADPTEAYALRIAPDGSTTAAAQGHTGSPLRVAVPRFPLRTPLRRIEVGVIGSSGGGGSQAPPRIDPL